MCSYGKFKVSDKTIQREFTAIRKLGINIERQDGRKEGRWGINKKIPMITTDFTNHKGMNVFELLWLFVDTPHTKLMEQFKNVPSMFHQNLRCLKTEIPASY